MQNYYVQFRIFYQYVHKYTILIKYVKIYKLIWTAGGSRLQMTLEARFVLLPNTKSSFITAAAMTSWRHRRHHHTLQEGATEYVHSRLEEVCWVENQSVLVVPTHSPSFSMDLGINGGSVRHEGFVDFRLRCGGLW